jgi:hypothetical protein
MDWNTVFLILEDIFYPLIVILLLIGLFTIFLGINQLRKHSYSEQRISWFNYPTILNGIAALSFALFYGFFVTGIHVSNFLTHILLDVVALAFGGLFILCLLRARRYSAFLPPKRMKRKRAQPKD